MGTTSKRQDRSKQPALSLSHHFMHYIPSPTFSSFYLSPATGRIGEESNKGFQRLSSHHVKWRSGSLFRLSCSMFLKAGVYSAATGVEERMPLNLSHAQCLNAHDHRPLWLTESNFWQQERMQNGANHWSWWCRHLSCLMVTMQSFVPPSPYWSHSPTSWNQQSSKAFKNIFNVAG